jgi:DNA-binding response OmpR family regulator
MAKRRILIVDDDRNLSHTLKMSLEESGPYDIAVENDPRKAKNAALKHHPEIILLDVIMPGIDGGTVASEMRQDERLKTIPIIFLTSIVDKNEVALKGGFIGSDPVLAKPITAAELIIHIEQCLAERKKAQ